MLRGLPDGTVVFPEGAPLQMRKAMLAAVAYRLSCITMDPTTNEGA